VKSGLAEFSAVRAYNPKIRLSGLGTLEVRQLAARMGRNPATGEAITIKASKKIAFRAAKELKEAV
jgi:DNA-binding protein HU-beta